MNTFVDTYFSERTGADIQSLRPGEIAIACSADREKTEEPQPERERSTPILILVTGGRGVVSTSRFMKRVATAWAEDFAAPDYLLRADFLEDLRADTAQAMGAAAAVRRRRVFVAGKAAAGGAAPRVSSRHHWSAEEVTAIVQSAAREGWPAVLLCDDADLDCARSALAAGCTEYARIAQVEVRR